MVEDNKGDALAGLDEAKRKTLRRLLTGSAFVAPIVTSIAIDSLTMSANAICVSNTSACNLSDRRLKRGIRRVATHSSGLGLYRFRYLWDDTEYVGVMAQEVLEKRADAVIAGADGFLRVDYAALGFEMLTYAEWQKRETAGTAAIAA